MDKDIFVQNIKKFCSIKGVLPTVACRDSGAGKDLINKLERGVVPSVEKVQLLADYLGITTSELLGEGAPEGGPELSPRAAALVAALDRLNDEGQEKLVDYADDLVASGKYKKSGPAGLGKKA